MNNSVIFVYIQAVEDEMSKPGRLEASTQQGIVNIMWSFARLAFYPPKFMEAVCNSLEHRLPDFNDQELSNCLWAFGRLAHHPGKLIKTLCECLDKEVRSFCGPTFSLPS